MSDRINAWKELSSVLSPFAPSLIFNPQPLWLPVFFSSSLVFLICGRGDEILLTRVQHSATADDLSGFLGQSQVIPYYGTRTAKGHLRSRKS